MASRRSFLKAGAVSLLGVAAVAVQLNDAKSNAKGGEIDRQITAQEKAEAIAKIDKLYPLDTEVANIRVSPEEKLAKLQKEAESGNATAQYMLGMAYTSGQVFTLEMTELDRPLAKNAEKFGIPDKASLGLADHASSIEWYQQAAVKGHGDALFVLSMVSANCSDVDRDAAKSATWFGKAAAQGHVDAQFKLGLMYANGDGVTENATKAVEWWQKAAAQGHVTAQAKLYNA
jgi:TPR repeat protein